MLLLCMLLRTANITGLAYCNITVAYCYATAVAYWQVPYALPVCSCMLSMCRYTFSSMIAAIALPCSKIRLPWLLGMECSMAACWRGVGMATMRGSSRLSRQPQSHHVRTDGCDLPRCSLSRPYIIRTQVDDLCSCSQEAA